MSEYFAEPNEMLSEVFRARQYEIKWAISFSREK